MAKKIFWIITVLLFSLFLCLSCDDGNLVFKNEMSVVTSRGSMGEITVIVVKANAASKGYNSISPLPDPEFTYTVDPDPLPDGVSLTGELERDSGELEGTYIIRQGTLALSGTKASKYTLKFYTNIFTIY